MTITAASIALAGIQADLQLGINQLQWVLNSFIVSYALLLLPVGAWSDRAGQRPLFLRGTIIFVVGALASMLARDVVVLIAGRALQGVGAALLTATAPAALALAFSNEADRKRAFGYMGASGGIGLASGALLAGAASSWLGWRAALALPTPVIIAASAVVYFSPAALVGRPGLHRVTVRGLIENRAFLLSCLVCLLFTTIWVALFIYAPLHMQAVDGLDPGTVGTLMLALLLPALVMPIVVSRLVLLFAARVVLTGGFVTIAVGLWCLDVAWVGTTSRTLELTGLALCGSGAGALYGFVDYIGLTAVPAEQAGLAAGAFNVVRLFGDIFAALIPGAVLLQVVGVALASQVGVTDQALSEIAAGNLHAIDQHELAVRAFVDGMHWALWVLLALTTAGALISLRVREATPSLRR